MAIMANVINCHELCARVDCTISQHLRLRHLQVLHAVPESVQGVLLTAGGHGAAYCFRNTKGGLIKGFVPVLKVKVADTTGAGDAFLSGFLYSMVKVKWSISCHNSVL